MRIKVSGFIVLSLLGAAATGATAQGVYIGGKGGFGSSSYSVTEGGEEVSGLNARSGVLAGILGGYQIGHLFAVELELLFARKGFESEVEGGDEFRVDYVQLPILARMTFSQENLVNPRVFAGAIVGFETACGWKAAGQLETVACPFETNSTEAGILVGGGVSISDPVQFTVDATFDFGLTNVRGAESGETSFKSRRLSFVFGIEYAFWDRGGY
ncbi:MAG: PorT family protein [Gemmatimonadota bacterium]|nr:MAG: PorT family protein [Gemmatimonadota bacterium]